MVSLCIFCVGYIFFLTQSKRVFLVMDLPREIRECSTLTRLTELEEKF